MSTALLHNRILAANLFLQNIELLICRAALMQEKMFAIFDYTQAANLPHKYLQ